MAKRKALSTRTRFEVFKRDGFKCQYCGKSAPEVVLECDHINPVANGGDNEILNLITACWDCNSGKSDKLLSDDAAVTRQVDQLQIINERRLQLEMMLEWKQALRAMKDVELDHLVAIVRQESGLDLNDYGIDELRKWLRSFGLTLVEEVIEIAFRQYQDKEKGFRKIGAICYVRKKSKEDPSFEVTSMARGILKKRNLYVGHIIADAVRQAMQNGATREQVIDMAYKARSWTAFRDWLHS